MTYTPIVLLVIALLGARAIKRIIRDWDVPKSIPFVLSGGTVGLVSLIMAVHSSQLISDFAGTITAVLLLLYALPRLHLLRECR